MQIEQRLVGGGWSSSGSIGCLASLDISRKARFEIVILRPATVQALKFYPFVAVKTRRKWTNGMVLLDVVAECRHVGTNELLRPFFAKGKISGI